MDEKILKAGNEPATSCVSFEGTGDYIYQEGISIRDYIAAKVLQGIYSNSEMWNNMCLDHRKFKREESDSMYDYVAQDCYKMADAMIKEGLRYSQPIKK